MRRLVKQKFWSFFSKSVRYYLLVPETSSMDPKGIAMFYHTTPFPSTSTLPSVLLWFEKQNRTSSQPGTFQVIGEEGKGEIVKSVTTMVKSFKR
jgi:hypothetical protein